MSADARAAAARAAELLGEALLPLLLGNLDGTTESFRSLARRLADDPRGALADRVALSRVEQARGEAHRVGWFLGCLASASGTDLLIARREALGLRLLCELVCEGAASDVRVEPDPGHLPRIATGVGKGWELPFVAGFLFHAALVGSLPAEGQGPVLRWKVARAGGRVRLVLHARLEAERAAVLEELVELLPEAAVEIAPDRAELSVPRGWLEP